VRQKKCDYTTSLRKLERISDSIHEQRSIGGGSAREPPANPPPYQPTAPPPYEDDDGRYEISQETVGAPLTSFLMFFSSVKVGRELSKTLSLEIKGKRIDLLTEFQREFVFLRHLSIS
ncbi:hypothetical protein DICVIV_12980, partial [Dictyocaulus viviparus]